MRSIQHAAEHGNALDIAEKAFKLLVAGPAPLAIDGKLIGRGLPDRDIDLLELRSILLAPETDLPARDAVWAELVNRSRTLGAAWTVACVGVALPGLKRVAARTTRDASPALVEDVVSSLLTAFLSGLVTVEIDRHSIAPRLLWLAKRAAVRARRRDTADLPLPPEGLAAITRPGCGGHEDFVLADAVRQQVITRAEAELIGLTRLEKVPVSVLAAERGLSARRLYARRERAEQRLVTAISEGKVTANSHGMDRNPGC